MDFAGKVIMFVPCFIGAIIISTILMCVVFTDFSYSTPIHSIAFWIVTSIATLTLLKKHS